MRLTHTEERRLLEESLGRYLRDNYSLAKRHEATAARRGYSEHTWQALADLGVIGSLFSAEQGGFAGAAHDVAVVFECLGRALSTEPFLSALLGGRALAALGNREQCALLDQVVAGTALVALAHQEPQSRYALEQPQTEARQRSEIWHIDGHKSLVLHGASATHFVISAHCADADAPRCFLVPAGTAGIELREYPTVDGGRAADLVLTAVELPDSARLQVDSAPGRTREALGDVLALGTLALCAESLGAISVALDMTLEYLRTREQFGVTIGKFQALQHRYIDLMIEVEQLRSTLINAASKFDDGAPDRDWHVSAAKYLAGSVGQQVAEECIQLHGGVAMTWDYAVGHYAKRLVMIDHMLGDTDHHLARCVSLMR